MSSNLGFAIPHNPEVNLNVKIDSLSYNYNDSILIDIINIINPEKKLNRKEKQALQKKIDAFPHRIVRRDTTRYFMETALSVAFYEYECQNYKKALLIVNEFEKNALPRNFIKSLFKYPAVGSNAKWSISEKGKIKYKKDRNSWITPLNINLNFSSKKDNVSFLRDLIKDLPLDGNIDVYSQLFTLYKELGGKLSNLYTFLDGNKSIFKRCKENDRYDILDLISKTWDFSINEMLLEVDNDNLIYNDTTEVMTNLVTNFKWDNNIFDPTWNINAIDSLINVEKQDSISTYLSRVLNLYYNRSNFIELNDFCYKYESFCPNDVKLDYYNYWGLAESWIGRYESSLSHLYQALQYSKSDKLNFTIYNNIAHCYIEACNFQKAISIYDRITNLAITPFDKFSLYDNLGYAYSFIDEDVAIMYFNQAENYLDGSNLYADKKTRHFCRKAHLLTSNIFLKRECIEKALSYTRQDSPDKSACGMAYTELGIFYNSVYNLGQAENYFKLAFESFSNLDNIDRRYRFLERCYSVNLRDQGNFQESISILNDLLQREEKILGKTHIDYLYTLRELIISLCQSKQNINIIDQLYTQYKDLKSSINYYNPTTSHADIEIDLYYKMVKGDSDEQIKILRNNLSEEYPINKKMALALLLVEKIAKENNYESECQIILNKVKEDIIKAILNLDSQESQSLQTPLNELLTRFIIHRENEQDNISNILNLSLFKKGLWFSTQRNVFKKLSQKKKYREQFKSLNALKDELNFAVSFEDNERINELIPEISRIERNLNHIAWSDKSLVKSIDRNISQVQSKLSEDDIAIDFIEFQKKGEKCYCAIIIFKNSDPVYINLFEGAENIKNGDLMWAKLIPFLNGADNIYFSTDGELNKIGIEFLTCGNSELMIHKYKLHRVFHLTDINKNDDCSHSFITLIGVSDHNSPLYFNDEVTRGNWIDLPNVEYEIKSIESKLNNIQYDILFNDNATEENVKKLSGSNLNILHFSTHGVYRSLDSLNIAFSDPNHFDHNIARRFLSSNKNDFNGLVLRGGNLSWKDIQILDDEDNILSAEEIETMNFPNLELTILSACETGIGHNDSEGVWGLQRAFRIAGSQNIVCSLSKVKDYETALFMELLYGNIAKNLSIYDSFKEAQKEIYKEYPNDPSIWSSFILIE